MNHCGKTVLAAILALAAAPAAYAEPVHSTPGPLTDWPATVNETGTWSVQPYFFYGTQRGNYDNDGNYTAMPDGDYNRQATFYALATYGLFKDFDLSAQTILYHTAASISGATASSARIGDSNLFARYHFMKDEGWKPSMSLFLLAGIPTGKYENAEPAKLGADITGSGAWSTGYGLLTQKNFGNFNLYADAYVTTPFRTTVDDVQTKYGAQFNYDFAVEYALPHDFNLLLEFNGVATGRTAYDGVKADGTDTASLNVTPGIGYSRGNISAVVGYQRTISGKNTGAWDTLASMVIICF